MRVKINTTDIVEVTTVFVTPGKTNEGTMFCYIELTYGDSEYEKITGEFKCYDATTIDECEAKAMPFINELYEKGYIDIGSSEKRKKYGITIY